VSSVAGGIFAANGLASFASKVEQAGRVFSYAEIVSSLNDMWQLASGNLMKDDQERSYLISTLSTVYSVIDIAQFQVSLDASAWVQGYMSFLGSVKKMIVGIAALSGVLKAWKVISHLEYKCEVDQKCAPVQKESKKEVRWIEVEQGLKSEVGGIKFNSDQVKESFEKGLSQLYHAEKNLAYHSIVNHSALALLVGLNFFTLLSGVAVASVVSSGLGLVFLGTNFSKNYYSFYNEKQIEIFRENGLKFSRV